MSDKLAIVPQNKYNVWELVSKGLIDETNVSPDGKLLPTLDMDGLTPQNSEQVTRNIYVRPTIQTVPEEQNNDNPKDTCAICLTREKKYVVTPCNHFCLCDICCFRINNKCPICRKKNISLLRIYN